MNWEVGTAKNGEKTLKLNDITIYSNYSPKEDAKRWIKAEIKTNVRGYLLIGLGLGYHLQALKELASNKTIIAYYFEMEEYKIFRENNSDAWWKQNNIQIVNNLKEISLDDMQLLLPNVWVKGIGEKHSLFSMLELIKINQISYKKDASKLLENFKQNIILKDDTIKKERQVKTACLVAAGPSLDETVEWLVKYQNDVDIFVVGAALKMLLAKGIRPRATVLSDATDETLAQFKDTNFDGEMYYLSTANCKSILLHKGKRYILYQKGYHLAEHEAKKFNAPLIETGGSVGTTTFSLIEQLGYEQIVLFGQDLSFVGENTHAELSTSKRGVSKDISFRKIKANDGSETNTTATLQVFLYWYTEKMKCTKVKVYNTATKGAKIQGIPLISEDEFRTIISLEKY